MGYLEYGVAKPEDLLSEANYYDIRQRMLASRAADSAAILIPTLAEEYTAPTPHPRDLDQSLGSQLADIENHSLAITQGLTDKPPEAYLLTANSAIPVADALRGYFNAAGQCIPQPQLGYIRAHSAMTEFFVYKLQEFEEYTDKQVYEAEIARLAELYGELDHVCVVDQYINTGGTVEYAGLLLQRAGVRVRTAIRGNWYQEAIPKDCGIDLEQLTSRHSDFMKAVGRAAYWGANN